MAFELLLRKRSGNDLRLVFTARCERDEELVPLLDFDTGKRSPLAVLVILQDLLLVQIWLEAEIRAVTLEKFPNDTLFGEPFGDFYRRLHLTEADLADRIADGLESSSETTFAATEEHQHF